jgi:hypothetical protein
MPVVCTLQAIFDLCISQKASLPNIIEIFELKFSEPNYDNLRSTLLYAANPQLAQKKFLKGIITVQ